MREFDLLQHVYAANASLDDARVQVPPGDDMAVVRLDSQQLLAAVDQLVDGRHVNIATTPLELVGRKAMTRSMSDIAAMAAKPVATLVAATLPPEFGTHRANALFDAMRKTAADYGCPLIGGDLGFHSDASHPFMCAVTVLAEPGPVPPVTRSGAQVGDGVYITGALGGSLQSDGSGSHLTFEPRVNEALELAETLGDRLHAMIDISDGLGRDAGHIAQMSRVRIEIDANRIPCNPGLNWQRAVGDGEDYELCFTASGDVPSTVNGVPVTLIGHVAPLTPGDDRHVVINDGTRLIDATEFGWQHES